MTRPVFFASILIALSQTATQAADPPKIELKNGDRIVYLGNTFVERDASYGYLETLLTIRHPNIDFTFRNLGWSGDTVWGDARARFGTRDDGFNHLKEDVLAQKPTIILVAYGMNESFAGEAGLPEFEQGLNRLLDTLAETKAKIVLISPIPHESLRPPLPDPAKHNAELRAYSQLMGKVAAAREALFVDLFTKIHDAPRGDASEATGKLTDNGIQLTEYGYAQITGLILRNIDSVPREQRLRWVEQVETDNPRVVGFQSVSNVEKAKGGVRFQAVPFMNPMEIGPEANGHRMARGYAMRVSKLAPGDYVWSIDGIEAARFNVPNGPYAEPRIRLGPEIDQVELVRSRINKKNELFFNRWRPQNETYLYLFRKHEQGNNAVEIPQFDPLIAEVEAEINKLKKPVKHTYEIIREDAGK